MSKLSFATIPSTTSLAAPSTPAGSVAIHIPSQISYPLAPYNANTITEINKVRLDTKTFVYHTELLRGRQLPHTMDYGNAALQIYTLRLEPLARTVLVTDEDGSTHQEHEVVLPPYSDYEAAAKVTAGVDLDLDGAAHQVTHHIPTSAHVWATAYILSPDHLLFQLHRIQNRHLLHCGSIVKAPSAWIGMAIVVEKVAELLGWTLLELRLLTTGTTIYLRVLSDLVAMDRTCFGRAGRWIRVTSRCVWGTYDKEKHAR